VLYQLRNLELVSTRRKYETAKNNILIEFRLGPKIQEIPIENLWSRIKMGS